MLNEELIRDAYILMFSGGSKWKVVGKEMWYWDVEHQPITIEFVDGCRHIIDRLYYSSGGLYKIAEYKNGLYDGKLIVYYESGQVSYEIDFSAGLEEGKYKAYRPNGCPEHEIDYKGGKIDGEFIAYQPSGGVWYRHQYKNGRQV